MSLTGKKISKVYKNLLVIEPSGVIDDSYTGTLSDGALKRVETGLGDVSPLRLGTTVVAVNGALMFGSTADEPVNIKRSANKMTVNAEKVVFACPISLKYDLEVASIVTDDITATKATVGELTASDMVTAAILDAGLAQADEVVADSVETESLVLPTDPGQVELKGDKNNGLRVIHGNSTINIGAGVIKAEAGTLTLGTIGNGVDVRAGNLHANSATVTNAAITGATIANATIDTATIGGGMAILNSLSASNVIATEIKDVQTLRVKQNMELKNSDNVQLMKVTTDGIEINNKRLKVNANVEITGTLGTNNSKVEAYLSDVKADSVTVGNIAVEGSIDAKSATFSDINLPKNVFWLSSPISSEVGEDTVFVDGDGFLKIKKSG